MIIGMTLHEHIERNSFAYCDELPPDVAEGLPLATARRRREPEHTSVKRALQTCRRVVIRSKR